MAETVMVEVPTTNLLSLPQGAVYHKRHGKLDVEVYHEQGVLKIRSTTDRINREVKRTISKAETVSHKDDKVVRHNKNKEEITKRIRYPTWWEAIIYIGAFILLLEIICKLIKK